MAAELCGAAEVVEEEAGWARRWTKRLLEERPLSEWTGETSSPPSSMSRKIGVDGIAERAGRRGSCEVRPSAGVTMS